jgi:hypothetical protein
MPVLLQWDEANDSWWPRIVITLISYPFILTLSPAPTQLSIPFPASNRNYLTLTQTSICSYDANRIMLLWPMRPSPLSPDFRIQPAVRARDDGVDVWWKPSHHICPHHQVPSAWAHGWSSARLQKPGWWTYVHISYWTSLALLDRDSQPFFNKQNLTAALTARRLALAPIETFYDKFSVI